MSDVFEDLDRERAANEQGDAESPDPHRPRHGPDGQGHAVVNLGARLAGRALRGAASRPSTAFPNELRQARWLLKERQEFIAEKEREADALLEEVKVQAERMVQRTEIVRQANHVAQRILDDANEEARRLRHEAEDYADQKLASFEIVLDRTMKTVKAGREKLQVSPLPQVAIGEQGDTSWAGGCRRLVRRTTSRASSTRTATDGRGHTTPRPGSAAGRDDGRSPAPRPRTAVPSWCPWPPCASSRDPSATSWSTRRSPTSVPWVCGPRAAPWCTPTSDCAPTPEG